MSKRVTWILALVFLALLALLLWMPRLQKALVKPTATPTAFSQKLFNFTASDVIAFKVISAQGRVFSVQRGIDNLWSAPGDDRLVDSATVEASLNELMSATILSELEDLSDLPQYGLGFPMPYALTITFRDGSETILNPGSVSPSGHGYYALVNSQQLFVLSKYSLGRLLDFAENPPWAAPTPTAAP